MPPSMRISCCSIDLVDNGRVADRDDRGPVAACAAGNPKTVFDDRTPEADVQALTGR